MIYMFLANGFEEIEALLPLDLLRRAGLNVTTVGAPMFAVTAVGKALTVMLPGLGMVLFPLLTVYVTHIVQLPRKEKRPA